MLPCLCFRRFRPVTDRVHIVTNSHAAESTGIACYHMVGLCVKRLLTSFGQIIASNSLHRQAGRNLSGDELRQMPATVRLR